MGAFCAGIPEKWSVPSGKHPATVQHPERAKLLTANGSSVSTDNLAAARNSDLILLASSRRRFRKFWTDSSCANRKEDDHLFRRFGENQRH